MSRLGSREAKRTKRTSAPAVGWAGRVPVGASWRRRTRLRRCRNLPTLLLPWTFARAAATEGRTLLIIFSALGSATTAEELPDPIRDTSAQAPHQGLNPRRTGEGRVVVGSWCRDCGHSGKGHGADTIDLYHEARRRRLVVAEVAGENSAAGQPGQPSLQGGQPIDDPDPRPDPQASQDQLPVERLGLGDVQIMQRQLQSRATD